MAQEIQTTALCERCKRDQLFADLGHAFSTALQQVAAGTLPSKPDVRDRDTPSLAPLLPERIDELRGQESNYIPLERFIRQIRSSEPFHLIDGLGKQICTGCGAR